MNASITARGSDQAITKLAKLDSAILTAMQIGLQRGVQGVVQLSQREYLSGPRPQTLDAVTGRLRQSLTGTAEITGDNQVTGKISNNVRYAAFHEHGFHGMEQVQAYTRVLRQISGTGGAFDGRRQIRGRTRNQVDAKGNRIAPASRLKNDGSGVQFVRAHTRIVNYTGRPFIAPALQRSLPLIVDAIKQELSNIKP